MTDDSNPRSVIQITISIISILVILLIAIIFFKPEFLPIFSGLTPTAVHPSSNLAEGYQPEIIPPLTDMPGPTQTVTSLPTITAVPTQTLIVVPTLISSRQLPDLTVTEITDPICVPGYEGTIIEFTIFVRNIGEASTRNFGSFDVGVFFILGQRRYSLEEWATQFDGVIGTSNMEVSNLHPNW